jgi:hypothetical protein
MIDWVSRRIQLEKDKPPQLVTYEMRCLALRPYTLVESATDPASQTSPPATENHVTFESTEASSSAGGDSPFGPYLTDEALIRDCYDALLDRLDRLGDYLEKRLMSASDMRPYIGYYVEDIAALTDDRTQAMWAVCFLTYVHFYHSAALKPYSKNLDTTYVLKVLGLPGLLPRLDLRRNNLRSACKKQPTKSGPRCTNCLDVAGLGVLSVALSPYARSEPMPDDLVRIDPTGHS